MPPYLAGRDEIIKTADKYLKAMIKGYPQQPVIYYGLRGVGKTVLLNRIEEMADDLELLYVHIEIAEKKSFIKQMAYSSKKLIHRMSAFESAKDFGRRALGVLQAFSLTYNPEDQTFSAGLSEPSAYITTGVLSEDLTDMLVAMGKMASKAKQAICFFVDEIQYMKNDEMEALVNALHRINQLRLPIFLFGAGLPKVLKYLGEVKTYSERLFKFEPVAELSKEDAKKAIVEPAAAFDVAYTEDAVAEIIRWSKGYPFFIQKLCNTVWEYTEKSEIDKSDVERVIPTFLDELDKSFFLMRYEKCTKKEHDFLFAMVRCGELPCTIANVAHILKKRVNSISPTRAQLINKGIIYSTGHGEIDFTVPLFAEYLKRINPELKFDGE
ncbi:MAG: ATP-binding protein [Lachnospiraceae bacterium]|nr:ATP-binding protein [Lachnospiraceae bacterium]